LYVLTRNNEISTFAPKEKIGFAFFFVLSFVFLAAYFFFSRRTWVGLYWFFFCWGRKESYFYINQSLFFLLSENINLSLSIRRLMYVAVIISMQYFLFLTANSGRGLDNDFFSYKKLVN